MSTEIDSKSRLTNTANKESIYGYIFVLSTILAPMTSWRIWKVGPAEVISIVTCLHYWITHRIDYRRCRTLSSFWIAYLISISFGCIYGSYRYPNETEPLQLLTWLFFALISVTTYAYFSKYSEVRLLHFIKQIVLFSCAWYSFLYLYSIYFSKLFFGATLWYAESRYAGGGTNPHQVALLFSCVAVLSVAIAMKERKVKSKLLYVVTFLTSSFLLLETKSSTGYMSLLIGMTILVLYTLRDARARLALLLLVGSMSCVFSSYIYRLLMSWIASDVNGLGRLELFSSLPTAFWKSPIIGLGPGIHALNGIIEFHNMYLEVVSNGGLIGAFIFTVFSISLVTHLKKNTIAISMLAVLYAFGLAGFTMRRLVFWLIISICLALTTEHETQREEAPTL